MTASYPLPAVIRRATPVARRPRRSPPAPTQGEKAAILLATLGPGSAAPLLTGVGSSRVRRFARILSGLPPAAPPTVKAVLSEFLEKLDEGDRVAGGAERTRSFLAEVLDPAEVEQAMQDIGGSAPSVWRDFARLPSEEVRTWIENEHPHVASIALTQLPADVAAGILDALPQEKAQDLVLRMGDSASAAPDLIGRIAGAIETGFLPSAKARASAAGPARAIAQVMNQTSPDTRDRVLTLLRAERPPLAAAVERIMFTFETIPSRVDRKDVSKIVKAIDEGSLLRALKPEDEAGAAVAAFFFENISSRLSDRLKDELNEFELPKSKDSDAARAALVTVITDMRDRGEIELLDPEDDE